MGICVSESIVDVLRFEKHLSSTKLGDELRTIQCQFEHRLVYLIYGLNDEFDWNNSLR